MYNLTTAARATLAQAKETAMQAGPGVYRVVLPSGNQIATVEVDMDVHRRVSAFVHLAPHTRVLIGGQPWALA